MLPSKQTILIITATAFFFCCQDGGSKKPADEKQGSEHLVMSVLWYQRSAEMRACYYQTFNFAKILIDKHLQNHDRNKKPAIVVDIDETILDNSPYEAWLALSGSEFNPKSWKRWTSIGMAEPLPGAVEFLNYAKSKGVEIFYISNRDTDELESTLKNLQKHNFPVALPAHLLLRTDGETDKTARRGIVEQGYDILLLIGDSLNDFDAAFRDRRKDFGFKTVDENKHLFGDRYLILPNPMYGKWETALYEDTAGLSSKEKAEKRVKALKAY